MEKVSIIIPSLNSNVIPLTLQSLLAQHERERIAEILVIGRDDLGLIPRQEPVRFMPTEKPVSAPVARNIGLNHARGDFLLFIDADCVATEKWLVGMLEHLQNGRPVVGGGVSLHRGSYWQLGYNIAMLHEFLTSSPVGARRYLPTLNLGVTREVVSSVGPFDETLVRGQDLDWTIRMAQLGYPLYFAPDVVVYHFPEINCFRDIWHKWLRGGFHSNQLRHRYTDTLARSRILDRPVWLLLLSPIIAAAAAGKIFVNNRSLLRHAYTAPVVFLAKMAWCVGASRWALQPLDIMAAGNKHASKVK